MSSLDGVHPAVSLIGRYPGLWEDYGNNVFSNPVGFNWRPKLPIPSRRLVTVALVHFTKLGHTLSDATDLHPTDSGKAWWLYCHKCRTGIKLQYEGEQFIWVYPDLNARCK